MTLKHLLPICALALPLCAQAVPASPHLFPVKIEDGTTIMMRNHGDEFFNFATDENGYLLTRDGKGQVTYKCDPNGARLKATPLLVEQMRTEAYSRLDPIMLQTAESRGMAAGPQRIAPHDAGGRTTFPTLGNNHYLVLLIDYPDLQWSVSDPVTAMNEKLNGENYTYAGSNGSMRQFFIENSYGMLNPTFDLVGVIRMPDKYTTYVGDGKYDYVREMVLNACELASARFGVNFNDYDIDGDGYVDNVMIFYPGYGAADTPSQTLGGDVVAIWPHNSSVASYNRVINGKIIGNYCCFNELNGGNHYYNKDGEFDGIGTPVHEFGHVLGLPDLYDPNYKVSALPGTWSTMCGGCYNGDGHVPCNYTGYERWCLRWTEYEELDDPGLYTLTPLSQGGKPLRVNCYTSAGTQLLPDEYYVFEGRDQNSFDKYLPYGGMLIWHINYDRSTFISNRVNSTFSNQRCHLITADGTASYALNTDNEAKNAAWPQDINYITPDTRINLTPRSLYSGRKPLPHYFTKIAFDPETGNSSFEYDVISSTPTLTTILHEPGMLANANGVRTNKLHLEWDAVEGADSYQLTMYRLNSAGDKFYESLLDEKNVGNVTSYDVNLTSNKLSQQFHIYVRPVASIPSAKASNEWVVVPNELKTIDNIGVDTIETEVLPVCGGVGMIDAPVAARVFTLAGAPCGRENLAPGIYLVNYAGKTYKVIVK